MQIAGEIETRYPSFTRSEKLIADRILSDGGKDIEDITLSQLSHSLGVGEATIVRFCKKLGLHGFQELKFHVMLESDDLVNEENSTRDEIKSNLVNTLEMTDSMLSQETIGTAIELINSASRVYFFGIGTSGLSASMGEARLFRFGKQTKAIVDSHVQNMQASLCDSSCLVIAVSASGETKDLIEATAIAQSNGAHIVAITSFLNSSLAKLSECVLVSCGKTNHINGGTFSTAVSQMYLLDILVSGYASEHWEQVSPTFEKVGWSMITKSAN